MRHTPETDEVFSHAYWFKDGYLHPGDKPVLGVDFDEKLAAKFPGSEQESVTPPG
jgi:mannonate dehydratase